MKSWEIHLYTSDQIHIGMSVMNNRNDRYVVQKINKINDRKTIFLSRDRDGYSVWLDTGECVIPFMNEIGYSLPYRKELLAAE